MQSWLKHSLDFVRTLVIIGIACSTTARMVSAAAGEDSAAENASYVVVVSQDTFDQDNWRQVVDALVDRHNAVVFTYSQSVDEKLPELVAQFPKYVCFVARSLEANRDFVAAVHQLTRQFDDDPYTDCFWGILTGYEAADALAIAQTEEPLTVRRTASGTEVALEMCEEGVWYCELNQHHMVRRNPGESPTVEEAPADTTEALVNTLNEYHADLFVTSGHATERNWSIGFGYRGGSFRSAAGQLYGVDTAGNRYDVDSPNPKVYLPIGNCLMGHIDGPDAMALAWMHSAGVRQMIGYTVPTWFGYGGWGCLDYFVEQPGRYSFTEAFFANHHALIHRLNTIEGDTEGLEFDRDVVAFYGDPAWEAHMAKADCAWEQTLSEEGGIYTLEILPQRGEDTFKPINRNGSQRGGRPIIAYLPHRVQNVEISEGADLNPVITDNFILIPNPQACDLDREYRIVFAAEQVE